MAMEKFHYTTAHGKISAPKFNQMPFGVVRKTRHIESDMEKVFFMLEEVLDERNLAILDKMSSSDVHEFITAWQADSGITLGESSAS